MVFIPFYFGVTIFALPFMQKIWGMKSKVLKYKDQTFSEKRKRKERDQTVGFNKFQGGFYNFKKRKKKNNGILID